MTSESHYTKRKHSIVNFVTRNTQTRNYKRGNTAAMNNSSNMYIATTATPTAQARASAAGTRNDV